MSDRQRMIAALKPAVEAMFPKSHVQHVEAAKAAVQRDGRIKPQALAGVVPLQTIHWWLPGTATVGNTQGAEIRMVQDARLRRIDALCKTAPVGGNITIRITNDGGVIDESVTTIQNGQHAGASGMDHAVVAGNVLRVDVIGVGATTAGGDISVQVAYLPVTG